MLVIHQAREADVQEVVSHPMPEGAMLAHSLR
jgi:hypothetical protein